MVPKDWVEIFGYLVIWHSYLDHAVERGILYFTDLSMLDFDKYMASHRETGRKLSTLNSLAQNELHGDDLAAFNEIFTFLNDTTTTRNRLIHDWVFMAFRTDIQVEKIYFTERTKDGVTIEHSYTRLELEQISQDCLDSGQQLVQFLKTLRQSEPS